jgi:preprotein translocase subunit SecA
MAVAVRRWCCSSIEGKIFQVPLGSVEAHLRQFAAQCKAEHDEVVAMGGLHILGTERHEARRIDNQLRGRAGRQGDPGSSRFFLSLEDDLLRIFRRRAREAMMFWLGMTEGVPIESRLISKRIENAQKAVEAQNFEARKHLLEYDDVMNKQRETIIRFAARSWKGKTRKNSCWSAPKPSPTNWSNLLPAQQHPGPVERHAAFQRNPEPVWLRPKAAGIDPATLNHNQLGDTLIEKVKRALRRKRNALRRADLLRWLERHIMLDVVDGQWKDHLLTLDHLKEGIGLRGYGQKDPLVEFKKEAFILFEDMMNRIDTEAVRRGSEGGTE